MPPSLQFPILNATRRKKSVYHYLGSDIRGKTPAELAYGKRADAEIVGSYAALRWVPEAHVVPPGLDLREFTPAPPSDNPRPLVVHAPSNRDKKGTQLRDRGVREAARRPRHRRGRPPRRGARALRPRRHRRRPAERRLARRLRARGDGARQARRRLPRRRRRSSGAPQGFGIRVPIVPATKETLVEALRPLVESPALRREIGAASRAYVEQVHDIDLIADRLLAIYAGL